MCGVAGWVGHGRVTLPRHRLEAMGRALIHRGPDDVGVVDGPWFGIAHRRLSVIDTSSAGHQPMSSADGRYLLTYNGEVYNFEDIRDELEGLGHTFRTRTDTEVVLTALTVWGLIALEKLNGMFAFALVDTVRRSVTLARDRFGIKPLYWSWRDDLLLFGSEVKAIVGGSRRSLDMDVDGLVQYLHFQNLFGRRTLFQGINLLEPGSALLLEEGSEPCVFRWFHESFLECGEDDGAPASELQDRFRSLFRDAVRSQMVSDVPLGSYLSGGMDSGSIVTVASELGRLATFTLGFGQEGLPAWEQGRDERTLAREVARALDTDHHEGLIRPGDVSRTMDEIAFHLEEPRVGQSYPNYLAAQLASENVTVCLSGAGGDELFGGYPWRYQPASESTDFESFMSTYFALWCRLVPAGEVNQMLTTGARRDVGINVRQEFEDMFRQASVDWTNRDSRVRASLDFEVATFLQGLLLVDDKLAMAHGLETRVPMLDNHLASFAMRLPVEHLVPCAPNTRRPQGKPLVRAAMDDWLPQAVLDAPKQGFSAPDQTWFRRELHSYVVAELLDSDAPIYEYLDRAEVGRIVDDHLNARVNRRLLIWSLLYINSLMRVLILGRVEGVGKLDH